MRLTEPVITIFGNPLSGRDLILLGGGLFLIGKSTFESHEKLETEDHVEQILLCDLILCLQIQLQNNYLVFHSPLSNVSS